MKLVHKRPRIKPGSEKDFQNKVQAASWTSMTKNSVWNGVMPGLAGCFYYQLEGNKSISMIQAAQLKDVTWAEDSRC